jgi:hypothetical protein
MSSLTLSVTDQLRKRMEMFPEINWSEVARQSIAEKLSLLERMNEMLKNSTLTEKDAIMLGRKVNKAIAKRLLGE